MEGGQDRARPTGRPESVDDILARNGAPTTGGRAARRRAAEERESPRAAPPSTGRGRAPEPPGPPMPLSTGPHAATPRRSRTPALPPAAGRSRHGAASPIPDAGTRAAPTHAEPTAAARPRSGPSQPRRADPRTGTARNNAVRNDGAPPNTASRNGAGPSGPAPAARPADGEARARPAGRRHRPVETAAELTSTPVGPRPGDIGSGAPDVSEQAERARRSERSEAENTRSQRIDETLGRLTAAHAGPALPGRPVEDEAPRRRWSSSLGRLAVLVLAVLVFGTTTVGWATEVWLASAVRNVAALDPGSGAIVDAGAQKGAQNVLLVATGRGSTPGTATASPRPDTVVVAHVPAGGGPMTVLSVPAGLQINRPPCERFDPASASYTSDTVPAQARTQLATALDMGGPRCVTRVVQQLTGLAITQYVGLDLDRLGAAVDAVSGVRVCVTRPVLDRVLGPVVPDPGPSTLDGAKAADFARAAAVEGDPPADLGRVERQQQVVAGVLDTTLTSTRLLDIPRIAALRPALGAALTSDGAGLSEILALALALRGMGDVTFTSVPTTSGVRDTAVLRDADAAALFSALRKDAPLPAAATDTGATATGPTPGDLTVQLLNASGQAGLAAGVGDTLKQLGFGVGGVSNAGQPTPQTVIRYSPDQAAAAALLASTVPAATTVPDPGASGVLQLVLGRSFDKVVRAPVQPAAPAAGAVAAPSSCS